MLLLIGLIIGCLNAWHWVPQNTTRCRRIRMSDIRSCLAFFAAVCWHVFLRRLWWTVHKGVASESPALWFVGSLLLRTALFWPGSICRAGSLAEARACLLGFVIARVIVVRRLKRLPAEVPPNWKRRPALRLSPMRWFSGDPAFSCSIARSSRLGVDVRDDRCREAGHAQARNGRPIRAGRACLKCGHDDSATNQRGGLQHPESISALSARCSVYCGVNLCVILPGTNTHRFALDDVGAGDLRVCGRAALRY